MKNSSDTIGNRTRDLPICSAVPQPPALPRAPVCVCVCVCLSLSLSLSLYIYIYIYIYIYTHTHTHMCSVCIVTRSDPKHVGAIVA